MKHRVDTHLPTPIASSGAGSCNNQRYATIHKFNEFDGEIVTKKIVVSKRGCDVE